MNKVVQKPRKKKKGKPGRKGMWSTATLDDLVDNHHL